MSMETNKNIGWECPKCGRIWGPQIESCLYCNDKDNVLDQQPTKPFIFTTDQWFFIGPYGPYFKDNNLAKD